MNKILITLLLILPCKTSFAADDQSYLHYIIAEERKLAGDALGALDEYKEASLHDKDSAELRAKIAATYLEIGEEEKAEKEIAEALKLKGRSYSVLSTYLEILLSEKNYTQALKICEEILTTDPTNKDVNNYKIALLIELEKKKEASAFVKKYAKENPTEEFPHYYLGLMAYESGKVQEAEKEFLKAISFNPEHEPSIVTLMLMYEKTYSGEQLLKKLEGLTASTGGSNDDLNNRIIMVNIKIGDKEHLSNAINYLNQIYGETPLPYIAIEKSSLYDRINDKEAAIKELRESIKIYPKNEALIYALAILFGKYEQKDDALRTMEKLIELNPNDPEVLNYVGYSYAEKGIELKKARLLLEKAIQLSPDDPYVIDSLTWLNYKDGNLDAAKQGIEKTAKLIQQKSIFELDMLEHMLTIYKQVNDIEGQNKIKKLLTDMLNSKKHSDKKGSIRELLERINEEPQRSPASIKK